MDEAQRHDTDDDLLAEFGQVLREQAGQDGFSEDRIEGYRLGREIYRGGQGVVLAAHQQTTKRDVAIKLLLDGALASEGDRARFEREVELAAQLRHPSIVTVHESGRTQHGRQYIAMELVDGARFDAHIRERYHEGAPPSDAQCREVVRLFLGVCDAIEYAHRRGVIHRDLKPGNVMVTDDPRPVVLDFGIAKATGSERGTTKTGDFLGTLSYAAPEQLGGSPDLIDTRADVYALGVMLYEALTGARPSGGEDVSIAEAIRNVTQQDARRASSINPSVSRDLDAVLRKALERDPGQRYQTAGQLRDELARAISGRPVRAREHERWYLVKKYVVRRRVPIAAGLLAAAGVAVMGVLWLGQRQNAKLASIESMRASAFLDSLSGVDYQEAEDGQHQIVSIEQLLDEMSASIGDQLAGYPRHEAPVRTKLGLAYLGLRRQLDNAVRELRIANRLYTEAYDPPHELIASSYHDLGRALYRRGYYTEAYDAYDTAYEMKRLLFGDDDLDVAKTAHHLAVVCRPLQKFDQAERLWGQVLAVRRERLEPTDTSIASAQLGYAWLSMDRFEHEQAFTHFEGSYKILAERYGSDDWRVAAVLHGMGLCLMELGEHDLAWERLEEAENLKLTRSDELTLANTRLAMAQLAYRTERRLELGLKHAEWSAQTFERLNGPEYEDAVRARIYLAGLARQLGELEVAQESVRGALGILVRAHAVGGKRVLAEGVLADVMWDLGAREEARVHAQNASEFADALGTPTSLRRDSQERLNRFDLALRSSD